MSSGGANCGTYWRMYIFVRRRKLRHILEDVYLRPAAQVAAHIGGCISSSGGANYSAPCKHTTMILHNNRAAEVS
jgi:hypothetical protein